MQTTCSSMVSAVQLYLVCALPSLHRLTALQFHSHVIMSCIIHPPQTYDLEYYLSVDAYDIILTFYSWHQPCLHCQVRT